jgi:hypothetical protein
MSNINRIFKLAGNVGDAVVLDLQDRKLKGVSDGETVTIVAFSERHEGRTVGVGVPPGLWKNYSYATVRDSRGGEHDVHTSHLQPVPGRDYVRLPRQHVRGLPDTPFWEDDIVEVYDGRRGTISTIDYDEFENAAERPVYSVSFSNSGSSERFHARSLDLVERGNVWRYHHGEEIDFENAAEEATLLHRLSLVTGVTNRDTGHGGFSWDEAVQALRNGEADVIWHNWAVALDDPGYKVECYTIDDPVAGERCRAAFLEVIGTEDAPAY